MLSLTSHGLLLYTFSCVLFAAISYISGLERKKPPMVLFTMDNRCKDLVLFVNVFSWMFIFSGHLLLDVMYVAARLSYRFIYLWMTLIK